MATLNQTSQQRRLSIVVWSFSGYNDVLAMTLGQIVKFAPETIRLDVFILSDSPESVREILKKTGAVRQVHWNIVPYDESSKFWKKIDGLRAVPLGKTFLFLQDDFVLFEEPAWEQLCQAAEELSRSRFSFFRLVPSGTESPRRQEVDFLGSPAVVIDKRSDYFFSCQASLWKARDFLLIHRFARPDSIRDENNRRYRQAMSAFALKGVGSPIIALPYVQTAIREGRWDLAAETGGDILIDLLEQYGVDQRIRGVRTAEEVAAHRQAKVRKRREQERRGDGS